MFSKSIKTATHGKQRAIFGWLSVVLLISVIATDANVFFTVPEALEVAFPGARVERGTVYLTGEQVKAIEQSAGMKLPSEIVHPYRAYGPDDELLGTAYFDAHRVRTLPETLMIAISPNHRITRIEVLDFKEPQEYKPSERWYAQFLNRTLDDTLYLKRGIDGVTGATLTARATTAAARRILATHRVLETGAE